jgi:SAM-dependent methyltransferase
VPAKPSVLRRQVRRVTVAFSIRNRRRKAAIVKAYIQQNDLKTVIVSGASARAREPNEMIVERALLDVATVVCGFDIVARAASQWPFVVADGCQLPYRDNAADLVVSNAVIEHVGKLDEQRRFMAEHVRVGRHCIIATPNRWFPVESHTSAVFRHWSRAWRDARPEFTRLLSRKEFKALLPEGTTIKGRPWSATFLALIPPAAATD